MFVTALMLRDGWKSYQATACLTTQGVGAMFM
jgi:hypothetical protein